MQWDAAARGWSRGHKRLARAPSPSLGDISTQKPVLSYKFCFLADRHWSVRENRKRPKILGSHPSFSKARHWRFGNLQPRTHVPIPHVLTIRSDAFWWANRYLACPPLRCQARARVSQLNPAAGHTGDISAVNSRSKRSGRKKINSCFTHSCLKKQINRDKHPLASVRWETSVSQLTLGECLVPNFFSGCFFKGSDWANW